MKHRSITLKPIKKPPKQKPFAVMDIETQNWTKFIMLGHYEPETGSYFEFRKIKDYLNFLRTEQRTETVFAHFGGKFDFLFLLRALLREKDVYIEPLVPRGSAILYLSFHIGECRYNFRDSSALLPFGLKSLAVNFGVETQKQEWDHTQTKGYSRELAEYCKADNIALAEVLEKYFNWPIIKKAGPASTMASQSLRVFRTYLKDEFEGLNKNASEFVRKSYFGGRTEIFRPLCESGPLYEYDVNSLYPFIMVDNFFPVGNGYYTFNFDKTKLGVYEATVQTPEDIYIPVLGVVRNRKFIFPRGNFSGFWTSAELLEAEKQGYKIKIKKGYVWAKKHKIFEQYIKDLYEIRLTSPKNSVSDILAKLLMNSLYGRFGMSHDKENLTFDLNEGVKLHTELKIGSKNVEIFKEAVALKTFSHVGIATFVTSYARLHMLKLFKELGDDLYYTDTDSIFTTRRLPGSKALGDLKLESVHSSAVFLLPKTYIATRNGGTTKLAAKGFDKKKMSHFTHQDFKTALEGDLRRFKITNDAKFATLKSALAKKKIVTMKKASPRQLRAKYSKREIYFKNGEYYTKPITIKE